MYAAEDPPNITPEQLEAIGLPDSEDFSDDYKIDEDALYSDGGLESQPEATLEDLDLSSLKVHKDAESNGFRYDLPNGTWFSISVPANGISTQTVSLKLSEELYAFHAERDGEQIDTLTGSNSYSVSNFSELSFSEQGNYEVTLNTGETDPGVSQVFYRLTLPFRICDVSTNAISDMDTPPGFHLTGITKDGESLPTGTNHIPLKEDGTWNLRFESDSDPDAVYRLQLKLDRTAPELSFSKSIDKGVVRPPVVITPLEEDCEILVRQGSEQVNLTNNTLTYGGLFRVTARDSCGNERSYTVQVGYPVFRPSLGMIILFVVLGTGLGAYLLYLRRHIQIL